METSVWWQIEGAEAISRGSIALDLMRQQSHAIVRRVARDADVLIENVTPVANSPPTALFLLAHQRLRAVRPRSATHAV